MRTRAMGGRAFAMAGIYRVWPVMLIALLILGQSAYWAGGSKSLAHALDHDKAGSASTLGEQHHHVSHGGDTFPASDAPTDVEHNLLHEMEHVQLVPLFVALQRLLFDAALMAAVVIVCLARRGPERTFRPPRPAL